MTPQKTQNNISEKIYNVLITLTMLVLSAWTFFELLTHIQTILPRLLRAESLLGAVVGGMYGFNLFVIFLLFTKISAIIKVGEFSSQEIADIIGWFVVALTFLFAITLTVGFMIARSLM